MQTFRQKIVAYTKIKIFDKDLIYPKHCTSFI